MNISLTRRGSVPWKRYGAIVLLNLLNLPLSWGFDETEVATGDVAGKMGVVPAAVSSYRKRLIGAGLIESRSYGKLSFAVPYMREYLLAHR